MRPLEGSPGNAFKTVLIIDDDLRFVKLVRDTLREEGYTVYCGFDGHMAVDLAQAHHPDLILMDVNMPMMNGLQAFQRLRTDAETSRIPIILISEVVSQIVYPLLASAPRAAHLKKPLDLVDLTSLTREFIQLYAA